MEGQGNQNHFVNETILKKKKSLATHTHASFVWKDEQGVKGCFQFYM